MFDLKIKVERNEENLLSSPVADEVVMMNMKTGDYVGLNGVATSIWNLLENPITGDEICKKLLVEYEIDEKTCIDKTSNFLEELKKKDLLIIHG